MPRRKKRDDATVSLFPFMSVLASLIGILVVLIAANMVANAKKQEGLTQEEYDKAIEHKKLKSQIAELEELKEVNEEEIKKEKKTVFEMMKLQERNIALKQKMDDLSEASDDQSDAELQKIVENLQTETKELQKEQPTFEKRIAELQKEIEERKIQPKPKESVVIRPGGIGTKIPKNIFFVEANSTGIVVREHEGGERFQVSQAAIDSNDQYADFCQKVFDTKDSMILFLLRKSGRESYLWGAGFAESKFGVKTGKLPVPNEGEVDLSLFDRK